MTPHLAEAHQAEAPFRPQRLGRLSQPDRHINQCWLGWWSRSEALACSPNGARTRLSAPQGTPPICRGRAVNPVPAEAGAFVPENRDLGLVIRASKAVQRTERFHFIQVECVVQVGNRVGRRRAKLA